MQTLTKFAIVAAVAVVFVGVMGGILFAIPAIPEVVSPVNPAIRWDLVRNVVMQSCFIFGHYMKFPLSFVTTAITAYAASVGIKVGTMVYRML